MEMGIAKGARRWYNNKQVAEGKTATMFCARGVSVMARKEISKAMLKRLPVYLSYLKSLPDSGHTHISATALASALSMGEVQVRKDLATVSSGGRPKVGYLRESLVADLEEFLGYGNSNNAVIIGAGKLGMALMGYSGFAEYGLNIVAAFDTNPALVGQESSGKAILALEQLPKFCQEQNIKIGVITVRRSGPRRFATGSLKQALRPSGILPPPIWMFRRTFWCRMRIWRHRWRCCRST